MPFFCLKTYLIWEWDSHLSYFLVSLCMGFLGKQFFLQARAQAFSGKCICYFYVRHYLFKSTHLLKAAQVSKFNVKALNLIPLPYTNLRFHLLSPPGRASELKLQFLRLTPILHSIPLPKAQPWQISSRAYYNFWFSVLNFWDCPCKFTYSF